MFERFTKNARRVVVAAQAESRARRAGEIRTEHLLLALYAAPGNVALTVLDLHGVRRENVQADVDSMRPLRSADAEALATLGIDLDEVRRQVEGAFGPGALDNTRAASGRGRRPPGHIPFEAAAKKVLELSLSEALRMSHNYIGCEHVLLGMLNAEGSARTILRTRGMALDSTRTTVEDLVGRCAR